MKAKASFSSMTVLAAALVWLPFNVSLAAEKLGQAKEVVNRVRQPDLPQVSTTTKPSPVGQSVREYRPAAPSMKIKEPPAPVVSKSNPRNDPDVQRGYDKHQKEYGRK